jgi:hypothetical protein
MRRERLIARREKLMADLPVTGELLRGSLLERTVRNHARGCAKCASGEGHQMSVLTVSYPGGATRQFSLRGEMAPQARLVACQLSAVEGVDRGDMRAQSRAAAPG